MRPMVKSPHHLFALTIFALAAGCLSWAGETGKKSPVDVSWTDHPPVLDGKMNDACWQNATVARDFVLLPKGSPTQQTEVRLAYDARYLYVFWRVFESQPDSLPGISPEPGRDRLDRNEA